MALGKDVSLGPGDIVLDGDPAPPKKGHSTPDFRPMSIVAKRSPISATADHLLFTLCCIFAFRVTVCFSCVRFSFFSTSQKIGWEERLRNELFCVKWSVKP